MKDDNIQGNHRGSSPPFQDPEQDFFRWLNELKSIGQRDETASKSHRVNQPGNEMTKYSILDDDSRLVKGTNPEQQSFEGGEARRDGDEDSRWQDDGGESGEVV